MPSPEAAQSGPKPGLVASYLPNLKHNLYERVSYLTKHGLGAELREFRRIDLALRDGVSCQKYSLAKAESVPLSRSW